MKVSGVFSLEGETALVTGGGTGLGFAVARCFLESGARVVIVSRRRQVLEEAAQALGGGVFPVQQDITRFDEVAGMVERARRVAGATVSILVNNAGNLVKKPAVDTSPEELQSVLDTHVLAAHAVTRAVIPAMLERGHGHILFMASQGSFIGLPQVMAYCAAKSAYLGMTRSLASELSPYGVRVNAIAPGWIETEMVRSALRRDPQRRQRILSRTPMARFGSPEDVGWAATYLSSPAAKYVTGAVLCVDGGVSIGL